MRIELRKHPDAPSAAGQAEEFQPYLDTFLLSGASNALGGVLVLPGGGYAGRADYEGDPVAEKFNALGYHAFVLQYRTAPYRYPDPQRDLTRAVKIIRANAAKWRLEKLAVLGFSAGAHLAASGTMLAAEVAEKDELDGFSPVADAMILCYPVISLTDDFAHRGSGNNLFGAETAEEVKAAADMQKRVDASTPPAFLWHTADDDAVSVRNSIDFAANMWACGNTCELHVFPHGHHGRALGMGTNDIKQWPELAARFLEVSAGFTRA